MQNTPEFSWKARARSFKFAFMGIKALFTSEHNAWIHAVAAIIVICAGLIFKISLTEWAIITLTIGCVIAAEAINSSIEALADKITLNTDPLIKKAKDLAAAAVLFLACAAVVIGLIIFIPHIIVFFS